MGIGISLSGLASAVASQGGIGTIATVGLGLIYGEPGRTYRQNTLEAVAAEIRKARELTGGVLAVNIMSVLTNFSDLVQVSIKEKIDIIFSGAGLPLDLPAFLTKGSKTRLVPIVSSARAALIIAKKWLQNYNYLPDAFVVEGPEAGGHLGFRLEDLDSEKHNLQSIVPEVLKVTGELEKQHNRKIRVIAGGGINTGKQRLIQSPVGLPGRAIGNEFLMAADRGEKRPKSCKYHCIKSCNPKTTSYCIAEALLSAYKGTLSSGFAFSGSKGHSIKSITSVKEVFERLKREFSRSRNSKLTS